MSGQDTIYQMVTDRIMKALEEGTVPWHMPWKFTLPISMNGNRPYRGINPMLLALTAADQGFTSRYWGTFKHIVELGGKVKKGEKSTIVIFWKLLRKPNADDPKKTDTIPLLRFYRVFNADQVEGLPEKFYSNDDEFSVDENAETIIKRYLSEDGPTLKHGGNSAHYVNAKDTITLPAKSKFDSPDAYYATAFHECSHSTGHKSRLNRPGIVNFDHFGSDKYGKEELVAEMSAAFLCATAGIDMTFDNSASYVAGWLKNIKGDPKMVVKAAAQAQKASDMILGIEYGNRDENGASE